ncbi:dTDP-4-dehydrorhamnose reductase [Mannheimia indoligenes]|uniref:dTDP-4-dehydrorhamnose reductase n=1 Tax=Mannheimia indoligenes TaxID=3103145 RepID=UPI002FE58168
MVKTVRFLITGAGGQLGRAITYQLKEQGIKNILALAHHQLDIYDRPAVFRVIEDFNPDVVINAAAYTNVDLAESFADLAYNANVEGVRNLSEATQKTDSIFFHISTDYVFSGKVKNDYLYNELDPVDPLSIYGKTKYEGERVALAINPKTIIVRTAWAFGECGNNFVKTIVKLAKEKSELHIVGDQIGGPTYTGDIASALINMSEQILLGKEAVFGIYHFTGQPYVSWYEFANAILVEAEKQKVIERLPLVNKISSSDYVTPVRRPMNSCLDLTKIKRVFNIEPSNWQKALKNIKVYL